MILFEVPFHDVDMMGVVWHGHYYKYFELARTALFRQFRCDAEQLRALGLALPVIDSHCRYVTSLTYGMRVRATATLVETEFRLTVDYELAEATSGQKLARGRTTQAVVRYADGQLLLPVPPAITDLLEEDPGEPAA